MSTNPFRIPIGTSDPVDICNGLPLFPGLGTARVGATASQKYDKILDVSATIAITRLKISIFHTWGVAICGPAIGFLSPSVDVLRENVGNRGKLELTFHEGLEMEAGLFVGASVGLGISVGMQVYLPKPWYKVWSFAWQDAFTFDLVFSVDLISLLFDLIKLLLSHFSETKIQSDSQNRLRDVLPDLKKTFALVDQVGTSTLTKDMEASPKLTLPFNLANYFAPLKAANDRLSKIGGEISFGPSVHLQFPVTFNFSAFTIEGGLAGDATSATYGPVDYKPGNQVEASGPTGFNLGRDPAKVISHVKYRTGFGLGISAHFKVAVAKFFSFEQNSRSLDLSYLLTRSGQRIAEVENEVSTNVKGGCVLEPNMTLVFSGPAGKGSNFVTGQPVRGEINLPGFKAPPNTAVGITIDPPVAGFPSEVKISEGGRTGSFNFTFQNGCLATGALTNPAQTAPPGPVTPVQSYIVRASLPTTSDDVCTSHEVEMPLNITQRVIRCQRTSAAAPGPAPTWDRLAGASINADLSRPVDKVKFDSAQFSLWFPYVSGETPVTVPVTFTLLDENRQPYARSNVLILSLQGLSPTLLKPSAKGNVLLPGTPNSIGGGVTLFWKSKGPVTGYSNRFYLIVDAGCKYGQTEFWLDVWNWS